MGLCWRIRMGKTLWHTPEIQGQMNILRLLQTLVEVLIYQERRENLNLRQNTVIIPQPWCQVTLLYGQGILALFSVLSDQNILNNTASVLPHCTVFLSSYYIFVLSDAGNLQCTLFFYENSQNHATCVAYCLAMMRSRWLFSDTRPRIIDTLKSQCLHHPNHLFRASLMKS